MTSKIMLDTNVIARICHPTKYREVQDWFRSVLEHGPAAPVVLVSVLADYELRRKLVEVDAGESLRRLDELARSLRYVPVTAEAVRLAAKLRLDVEAEALAGMSDADLLMAAQAQIEGAVLVTGDRRLRQIPGLVAKDWNEIEVV